MESVALTLGFSIKKTTLEKNLKKIINQVYKLLPLREEGKNWQKPLQTLIEELVGMSELLGCEEELFFSILCKMRGLFSLDKEEDNLLYRRVILETLNLLNMLKENVCFRQTE